MSAPRKPQHNHADHAGQSHAEWLRYANQGAVRNQELSPRMVEALGFLADMGIQMEVFSGGQPEKGSGLPRVGSVRHDHGDAADVFFYKDGRRLDWGNEADIPVFQDIVRKAKQSGLTGFGAGPGYMQQGSMHIGYGTPAVWGDGGKGVNAPNWLRAAYDGVPVQQPTNAMASPQYASAQQAPPQGVGAPQPGRQEIINALAALEQRQPPQLVSNQLNAADFMTNAAAPQYLRFT